MTVVELQRECRARGLSDEGFKKELQSTLKEHLGGVQRVRAMLLNNQGRSLEHPQVEILLRSCKMLIKIEILLSSCKILLTYHIFKDFLIRSCQYLNVFVILKILLDPIKILEYLTRKFFLRFLQ